MSESVANPLLSLAANASANYEQLTRPAVLPLPVGHVSWMYERLIRSIAKFEEDLDQEQEIGARLVTFGNQEIIHIEDLGYWGPDLVIFYGKSSEGKPLQLLQHQSQVNVLLVAVPKEGAKPRRIGFELMSKLEDKDSK
jgi:hypothetical protein